MRCMVFSNIRDLSTHQMPVACLPPPKKKWDLENASRHCQMSPRRTKLAPVGNQCLNPASTRGNHELSFPIGTCLGVSPVDAHVSRGEKGPDALKRVPLAELSTSAVMWTHTPVSLKLTFMAWQAACHPCPMEAVLSGRHPSTSFGFCGRRRFGSSPGKLFGCASN